MSGDVVRDDVGYQWFDNFLDGKSERLNYVFISVL